MAVYEGQTGRARAYVVDREAGIKGAPGRQEAGRGRLLSVGILHKTHKHGCHLRTAGGRVRGQGAVRLAVQDLMGDCPFNRRSGICVNLCGVQETGKVGGGCDTAIRLV